MSYLNRLDWTNENLDKIIKLRSVIESNEYCYDSILEPLDSVLFLSCCVELLNYLLNYYALLCNLISF